MAKISQIKLTNTTYDIDVASDLKATKIIGEDPDKIASVGAVQHPDGTNPLFDDNNKISSHYISDTILGQLKFGGTLTGWNFLEGSYTINPSQSILSRLYELTNYPEDSAPIDSLRLSQVGDSYVSIEMRSNGETKNGYNDTDGTAFEGFYFISASNLANGHAVGDWLVINNKNFEKIDNTDTITHIEDAGTSLLEITGTSGLKLNGLKKSTIGIELTSNLYTQSNGCITCGGSLYGGSISGGSIAASSKMTAPTITDASDKTQVVNLDYFENNATKVDWENIDSDVRIINGHNFKIQGKYTEQNIGCGMLPSSFDSIEPQRDSSTGQWRWGVDESWTSPYWGYFRIKKNCRYIVKPAKTSGPFNNAECLDSGASVLVAAELSTAPLLELTSEDHDLIYQPSVFDEVSWEPSFGGYIEFKSPIDGFAFFGTVDTFDPVLWVVIEGVLEKEASAKIEGDLKVTGNIEITGDLSFGADSHLVFGTIEGTDFIADHAKVKNAPVEDDDVINKAYFDANKGSSEGGCVETVAVKASEGLVYELTGDEYSCTGIGTFTDTDIVIAAVHNGLPVTSIGDMAFEDCSSLTSITIPDSVTSIGGSAFWNCTGLTSITIPDSVTVIGSCAFDKCSSLTSIEIPDSVISIGVMAFEDCSSLTSIVIPDSVTSISDLAFYNCSSLTIYCEADSKPKGWHKDWNLSNRPVVWGAALSIPAINDKLNNSGNSDISNYQGNAKINGNLEVTGNLSFDGDLEMSSIEAQSIKINGKRVLTEDDLANLVAYPAAEDYTF